MEEKEHSTENESPPEGESDLEKDLQEKQETPAVAPPAAPQESGSGGRLRRWARWALVLLLTFALGMLLISVVYYLPAARASRQVSAENQNLADQVGELEAEVAVLEAVITDLEAEAETLQEELDEALLYRLILTALAEVQEARLALAQEEPQAGLLALTNTPDTLQAISELVRPEHQETVQAMIARLDLALLVLEDDPEAAASDLEVLAANLVKLEKTYFLAP